MVLKACSKTCNTLHIHDSLLIAIIYGLSLEIRLTCKIQIKNIRLDSLYKQLILINYVANQTRLTKQTIQSKQKYCEKVEKVRTRRIA